MAVAISSRPYGTGRELVVVGNTIEEVAAHVKTLMASIDFMRSPSVNQQPREEADGKVTARVVYYGLD